MNITLKTNDGRAVAVYETFNKIIRKEVNQETHQLKYPPAWTYDDSIINAVMNYVGDAEALKEVQFVVECIDTGKRYEIGWSAFIRNAVKMKWRQNARFQQYRVDLKFWKETDLNRRQLNMFEDN